MRSYHGKAGPNLRTGVCMRKERFGYRDTEKAM